MSLTRTSALALGTIGVAVALAGCGGSNGSSTEEAANQRQASMFQIDQIESDWHRASSTKNLNLMMSLWAPDATFNIGTDVLTGKAEIRKFFETKAGPFQPQNHWLSDTPAYKIRVTVNGDKGTLYFECHYIDYKTGKVASVVGADQNVQKIDGKWLIVSSAAATPTLTP
jgi:ketosteroid isomerase-like protein